MKVDLAYGSSRLTVELPDGRTTVVQAPCLPAPADSRKEVLSALRHPVSGPPLREIVHRGQTVAIAVCDGTRAQPRRLVLPLLLEELDGLVDTDDIVVLVATGTHRGNTPAELREMLGDDVLGSVRVANHDARDPSTLTWCGYLGDHVPVWLSSEWLSADVRVTTGLVEPHFFAGFSGGPKMVAPGLTGLDTTMVLHDYQRINHPMARWGTTVGNPVHDDVRAIAAQTGVSFALDVVLGRDGEVLRAFGGELPAMHEAACALARQVAMFPVPSRFDVVVTSNAGFPLDQNLYQAVKGMSAAAQVVRPGGTIICAAECRDGFPGHGMYRQQLVSAASPRELLDSISARDHVVADQWQVQIQASIMLQARVVVHTRFLGDAELRKAHLDQTHDIAGTVAVAGPDVTVCALPEGPMTVPYVA